MTTIALLALLGGVLAGGLILWGVFLALGLRWARVEGVTRRRVIGTTLLIFVLEALLLFVYYIFVSPGYVFVSPEKVKRGVEIAAGVLELLLPTVVIALAFRTKLTRAFLAWLPTLIPGVAGLAVALFIVRPFIVEAYQVPSNAMAPTILGHHVEGRCPTCGEKTYCTPPQAESDDGQMICRNFHVSEGKVDKTVHSGDRILAVKLLTPRRWDLIVFHYPEDPATVYLKRVVGLPGEEIEIRDGDVWANGEKVARPEEIAGIEYLAKFPFALQKVWGSPEQPARLGPDEYFVLGDFSARSKDSRLWQKGAPGHPPYAVPKSHLIGVATHIYWPTWRWRVLR